MRPLCHRVGSDYPVSMLTVHIRVTDTASGRPTPVRLRITGPDGAFYVPFGRSIDFPTGRGESVGGHLLLGAERWVYADGSCEMQLPTGVPLRVQAWKGPEYQPVDQTVTLGPGQMAIRLAVKRRSDIRADGWYPGDTRCHFLPPHAALLEAAAEDLDVVNVLATPLTQLTQDGKICTTVPDLLGYSGQSPALSADDSLSGAEGERARGGRLVAVNTLNTHPVLGRVGLLHTHRPVFPLTFGPPDETDDWSVCDWCDQCHRKGGLAVWVDAFRTETLPGEALVALILGKIDAIELDSHPRRHSLLPVWYRLLDAGLQVPLVGGSGKDSNRIALGAVRTYARLMSGESLTYKNWIEAVRAGRTFATNGPLLSFAVEGARPGETIDLPGTRSIRVRATVNGTTLTGRLEVVMGSKILSTAEESGGFSLEIECSPTESAWVAARYTGSPPPPATDLSFAHTSPVYIRIGGQSLSARPEAVAALQRSVEEVAEWVNTLGRFHEPKKQAHLLELCRQAGAKLGGGGVRG